MPVFNNVVGVKADCYGRPLNHPLIRDTGKTDNAGIARAEWKSLDFNLHLAVLDAHGIGLHIVIFNSQALTVGYIELPAVPGATDCCAIRPAIA